MLGEWPEVSLEDLCELIVDCPHSTPEWTDSGVVVLRNQYIRGGRLDLSNSSYTTEEGYLARIKRAIPSAGDLVLTREAPMGEVCQIPEGLKCCLGQRMVLLRPAPEKVDSEFLLFSLQSPYLQHQINWSEGTGTTVSNIRLPDLRAFKVPVPSLQVQKAIAGILKALDDKIELNRQINATLESMAQALFKSWFVDFDPVIDNALAAGNPIPEPLQARADKRAGLHVWTSDEDARRASAMDGASQKRAALLAASAADTRSPNATDNTHPTQTAPHTQPGTTAPATPLQPLPADLRALFPDSFVFNEEMGWVPAGWPSGLLDEIAHYGSERISVGEIGHANYVSTENLIPERGGVREASSLPTSEWVPAFTDGSILVSNIRPYFKKIWMARRVGGRSNDVLGFESRLAGAEEYLYCLLCQDKFFDYMMATAKGTKMPRGDKKAIMNWQVVIPSDQLMREFSSIIRGFLLSAQARSEQSLSLASIRDSILPRLLRGEIRIEDVHQSLAEVV